MYGRQFRGYLRKSKFSRLSKRYNAQPPAGIFHIYPIDDSDDVGFNDDILFMMQSLTTHIFFNSLKASNSKPHARDGPERNRKSQKRSPKKPS